MSWIQGSIMKKNRVAGLPKVYKVEGVNLDGTSQYGTIGGINGVAMPQNWTYLCWFKLNKMPGFIGTTPSGFFTTGNTTGGNWLAIRIGVEGTRTSYNIGVSTNNSVGGSGGSGNLGFSPIDLGVHLLVLTYTYNVGFQIYRDGEIRPGTTSIETAFNKLPSQFYASEVGRDLQNSSRIFPGILGEMRFIPQLLSSDEIKRHWNKGKGLSNLDSLPHLFWYKFKGNGNDLSGNSRNITFTGSPSFTELII